MELKICHMYPDVLNLYGDRGNVKCLQQRLRWRGIDSTVERLPIGTQARLGDFDLVFIGGGQDFEQQVLLEDLHRGKDREIRAAIEDGVPFLTICGGYQMLGHYYETYDGQRCDFIGALDLYTVGSKQRMIGNYKSRCWQALATTARTAPRVRATATSSAPTATVPCCRKIPPSATSSCSPHCSASTARQSSARWTTPRSWPPTTRWRKEFKRIVKSEKRRDVVSALRTD